MLRITLMFHFPQPTLHLTLYKRIVMKSSHRVCIQSFTSCALRYYTGVCREACSYSTIHYSTVHPGFQVCEAGTPRNCTTDTECSDDHYCIDKQCKNFCEMNSTQWSCDTSGYMCQNGYCFKNCPETGEYAMYLFS